MRCVCTTLPIVGQERKNKEHNKYNHLLLIGVGNRQIEKLKKKEKK